MEDATEASTQLNSIGSKNFKRLIAVWTLYFTAGDTSVPSDSCYYITEHWLPNSPA